MAISSTSYKPSKKIKAGDRIQIGQWIFDPKSGEMKRVQVVTERSSHAEEGEPIDSCGTSNLPRWQV